MLAGHSIVRVTHRAGCGTGSKYRECPAEIGTVGSYEIIYWLNPLIIRFRYEMTFFYFRVKELRGGGAVGGVLSPVSFHDIPSTNKEKDAKKDGNDLAFLHRSKVRDGKNTLPTHTDRVTLLTHPH